MTAVTQDANAHVRQALKGMFGRDSAYMAMWGVQLMAAALFTPIITRLLSANTFGQVAAAVAVMQVLFAVGAMRLQSAIQKHFANPGGALEARKLVTLTILIATSVTAVAELTGPAWSRAVGFAGFSTTLQLAVLWAGVSAVTDACLALIRSRDRLLAFGGVSLMQSVLAEALSLVLVLMVSRTAATFIAGHLFAQAVAVAVALTAARPARLTRGDIRLTRSAARYAAPLVPAALAAFVLNMADRLLVQHGLGSTAVGRYQVAYNVGCLPITLLSVLNTVWMPRIFLIDSGASRVPVLARSRDAIYSLLTPTIIGMALGAPLLLRLWAPRSYSPQSLTMVVSIVAISAFPFAVALAYTRTVLMTGNTAVLGWSAIVAAGVNIGLNLLLIPPLGLTGSALATLISYGVLAVLVRQRAQRDERLPSTEWRCLAGVWSASSLAVVASVMPADGWWLVVRVVITVICLAWFAKLLRALATGQAQTSVTPHEHVDSEAVLTELVHTT